MVFGTINQLFENLWQHQPASEKEQPFSVENVLRSGEMSIFYKHFLSTNIIDTSYTGRGKYKTDSLTLGLGWLFHLVRNFDFRGKIRIFSTFLTGVDWCGMLSYLHALKTLNTAAIHCCGQLFVIVTPLHVCHLTNVTLVSGDNDTITRNELLIVGVGNKRWMYTAA